MDLDYTETSIINELIRDAKAPLRKLAVALGVSFVTVMNRIRKLEKAGIITKYSANIDFEKLGYGVHVIIDVKISKGKLFELEKKLAKQPDVYAVYDTTGEFDATLLALFKSTRALDAFVKKIQTWDFVERTSTKLILNTIKEDQIRV